MLAPPFVDQKDVTATRAVAVAVKPDVADLADAALDENIDPNENADDRV